MLSLHPAIESANLARRVGVVLGSLLVTFYYCSKVLLRAVSGRLRRADVDRYTRRWSGLLLRLVRMNLSVHGAMPDFNDGRRYILLSSHASHYDIPASFVALPGSIRMLAKKELFGIPIFGSAIRAAEFPSVDRHNRQQAVKDLEKARSMMESGIVLWAAPEGTRSRDGQLLPFKKGCFHLALDTNAVIVPIAFRGISEVLPARTWRFNLGLPVQLHIGAPIDASRYDVEQLPKLMAQVRLSMQDLLGEPAPTEAPPRLTEQPV
ncbi:MULTISPECIES: lysophospholipid acyltransferase family protein [unclassified Pseudomonas]|uniref:lysophospholipid acyltransferase family protein n=1 Tax=unclassified Pseudomonas TaxID=196821 RepID=UPI00244C76BE|nr:MULTISPECIES: lysophospholipid acyltransferase family protein [unclassified Pseudomonas]MDG9922701.1 1-acyl-sn-glycerol-3-phosphate acyltransferase [Pseudomonas sp. GD04045]MDH0033166.1 1-acyl-sn-glycerol-3-phosphate acyltransferase [Pseudomonas sp. GD04019]